MADLKTFVFTDIVRSVDLKNEMPGRSDLERDEAFVATVLLPHRQRIERALAATGGRVVSTAGDSHFLVFTDTIRAARWAIATQVSHRDDPISTPAGNTVSVRMSMHVGIPQSDPRDANNFIGKSVDYAARLNDFATGGQILVSRSVVAILEDAGVDDMKFHAHGQRELKGIGSIEVHELVYDSAGPRATRPSPRATHARQWTVLPATVGITDFQGASRGSGSARPSETGSRLAEKKLGNYELLELLGSGGMGDVYKARHVPFDRIRTVKIIKQHFVEGGQHDVIRRFYQEIKAVGRLEHPNIVVAIDSSAPSDAVHFLVMEYVDGVGVDRLIEYQGPLKIADACEIARQAARGLQYIHQHGMVHRDVKPSNLMLTMARGDELTSDYPSSEEPGGHRGVVKILDLGLALLVDNDADRLTRFDGRAMGTAMYMAPEQWRTTTVDIRADIYSLGCTLYHLLSGKPPFVDSDLRPEKAHEKLKLPPIERPEPIPRGLWTILQKMMAKEVNDRYATPAEVAAALASFSQGHDLAALVRRFHQSDSIRPAESVTTPASQSSLETAAPWGRSRPSDGAGTPRRWYSQVVAPLLIGLVAAVGAYKLWPPPPEGAPQPYDELIALAGLNGGWWFHELPQYLPAVREKLLDAMQRGDFEHNGVDVSGLWEETRQNDAAQVYEKLKPVIESFDRTLTAHQQSVSHQLETLDPLQENYATEIERLCIDLNAATEKTAVDWHLLAVLYHEIGRWQDADAAYRTALEQYEAERQWPLYALCAYDHGQWFLDVKRYGDAAHSFSLARLRAPNPTMTMLALCQEAQATYRLRNLKGALRVMQLAWDVPEIETFHPLRAYVLERQGWIQLEYWQISAAEDSFRKAQDIVQTQVDKYGNEHVADLYIWAGQGLATAQTFAGQTSDAIATYETLLENISQAFAVPSEFWLGRVLTPNQRFKLRERRPSIYLRLGDCYLARKEYARSSEFYQKCIDACLELNWEETDHRAPFVIDWRYIACLPLALEGDSNEAEEQFERTTKREEVLRAAGHLPNGTDTQPSFTRSVVRAILDIRSDETSRHGLGVSTLIGALKSVDANDLGRHHLGLFLLSVEVLAEPTTPIDSELLNELALVVTKTFNTESIGRELEILPYLETPLVRLRETLQVAADRAGESSTTASSLRAKVDSINRLLTPPPPRDG